MGTEFARGVLLCALLSVLVPAEASVAFGLRLDRGVPRIFRDGTVMPSRVFFGSFMHGGFPKAWESVPRQFSYALDAGVPFFETHGDLFWEGCDEAKVAAFNRRRADAFFAVATNRPCWMIVRLLCNPPTWWMDAHPETYSGWNDKSKLTGWVAKHPMQTLASSVYQDAALKAIRRTIAFYEREYPGRMAGYHLAGLHTSEWVYDGFYTRETEGYDEPTKKGFAGYLKRKYGEDAADSGVPSHAQRVGDGVKFLREPADPDDARIVDFNEYRTRLVSATIRRFARAAREAQPGRLIGFFYGYITQGSWFGGGGRNGYLSLREVLDSPDIDFFCSPFNYNWRSASQPLATQGVLHSIALAGKLWLNEDDTATYLACRTNDGGPSMFSKCPTPAETADMLRRNLAYTYLNNQAIWWMDLNGAGWFDDPEIWRTMREFAPLERDLLADPVASSPEFAVAYDHCGALHFEGEHSKEAAPPNWAENMVGAFGSLGAPLGVYLADDILSGRASGVKAAVFPTSYAMDARTRRQMRDWTADHGAIWVWAPGYVDLETGRASLAAVKDATGFEVRELAVDTDPRVVSTAVGLRFGLPGKFGPFARFGAPKLDTYKPVLSPVPQPGDVVLANYLCGEPAVVLRRGSAGRPQVFCGTYQVPDGLVRGVASASGVHFYAPNGTAVYTNGRDIGVYAMRDGEVTVTPKAPGAYRDYFTGRAFSGAAFAIPMRKGETVILEKEERKGRK